MPTGPPDARRQHHATLFSIAGALLLVGIHLEIVPVETFWPVRTTGTSASILVVLAFAFWAVIAVASWRSHVRRRRT
jgi:hypothetical protein